MLILGVIYNPDNDSAVPVFIDTLVKASAQLGTLIGQFWFGFLADRYGRKRMYGIELLIIMVGTVGASFSANLERGLSIYAVLAIWRIFMGIGIGGDYPLSAIITSEYAGKKYRGAMMVRFVPFSSISSFFLLL
jgi:PHS family inorganic phosphate transporter-like MFS transporter